MLEKKANPLKACELKFDGDQFKFEGYASVFDSVDAVNDTILKGAFADDVGRKIPMLVNHDHKAIPIGSYQIEEDSKGLYVEGSINPDHSDGRSAYSSLKREEMTGQSIGFVMGGKDFVSKDDGGREIHKVSLKEISLVNFPCDSFARITAVKQELLDGLETITDLERFLRDEWGLSKSMACTALSHFKRVLSGDLIDARREIGELKKVIARHEADRLTALLKSL